MLSSPARSGQGWEPVSSERGSRGADREPGHEGHCGLRLWTSTGSPTGTQSIEGLGLERRGTRDLRSRAVEPGGPAAPAQTLPVPSHRRLDANLISLVPDRSFEGLTSLHHLWLDDNALTEIPVRALGHLRALQAVTLALNRIGRVPDYAFWNLSSLVVL